MWRTRSRCERPYDFPRPTRCRWNPGGYTWCHRMATAVCYAEIRANCGCAFSHLTFTLLYKLKRAFYKQEIGTERAHDFPKVTQPECMKLESELRSTHESASMGNPICGCFQSGLENQQRPLSIPQRMTWRQLHAVRLWVWL